MSVSSLLLINTLSLRITTIMRVYDIIALNEELDVKPGVLGSDGKPVSWQVVDNQTGRVAQTFSGPDADGKAEEFRDAENARRKGGKPADSKADSKTPLKDTEPSPKNKTLSQKISRFAAKTAFNNLLRIGRAIGFSQLPSYVEEYQLLQADLHARYLQAIQNGMPEQQARAELDALSKAAFGQWVAGSGVITLGAELIVKLAAAGGGAVVKAIRTWNAGTSIAAGATGVGLLPAIIKFVLVEGAIWAVAAALTYTSVAKAVFTYFVGASHDLYIKALYSAADLGAVVGSGLTKIVSDDETRAAWRDVQAAQDTMGMDPMRKQSRQAIGGDVDVKRDAGKSAAPLSSQIPD
jgi:hypothetical protein